MKILVTGVKGQLGFDVVNELEKRGHTAIGVEDRKSVVQGKSVDLGGRRIIKKKIYGWI